MLNQTPYRSAPRATTALPAPEHDAAEDSNILLDSHNYFRQFYDAQPLAWDDRCSSTAQAWAEHLVQDNELSHGGVGKGMGQNLWWSPDDTASPEDAVVAWMREKENFDETNPSAAGNFTQVVWKKTKKVGLGIVRIPRPSDIPASDDMKHKYQYGTFVVANYYPQGNTQGKFTANVHMPPKAAPSTVNTAVKAHSHYRRKQRARPLVWDDECYISAQHWADQLSKGVRKGQVRRDGMKQNLWWSPDDTASPQDAVAAWSRGWKVSDETSPWKRYFTQLMCKKTRKFGLGIAHIPSPKGHQQSDKDPIKYGTFVVANYTDEALPGRRRKAGRQAKKTEEQTSPVLPVRSGETADHHKIEISAKLWKDLDDAKLKQSEAVNTATKLQRELSALRQEYDEFRNHRKEKHSSSNSNSKTTNTNNERDGNAHRFFYHKGSPTACGVGMSWDDEWSDLDLLPDDTASSLEVSREASPLRSRFRSVHREMSYTKEAASTTSVAPASPSATPTSHTSSHSRTRNPLENVHERGKQLPLQPQQRRIEPGRLGNLGPMGVVFPDDDDLLSYITNTHTTHATRYTGFTSPPRWLQQPQQSPPLSPRQLLQLSPSLDHIPMQPVRPKSPPLGKTNSNNQQQHQQPAANPFHRPILLRL